MIPFNGATPARGEYFYGRERESKAVREQAWTWVCGPRRMGKSSLLLKVQDVEAAAGKAVPLYLDLASIQNKPTSAELFKQFFRRHLKGASNLSRFGVTLAHFEEIDETAGRFRALVEKIEEHGQRTMFLWDEAEHLITLEKNEPGFLDSLRSALQDIDGFRFVVAGSQRFSEVFGLGNHAEQFISSFTWLPISGLPEAEARAVLLGAQTGGWETSLPQAILQRAVAWTGGYSLLVQNLGQELWNACGTRGDRVDDAMYARCVAALCRNPMLRDIMSDDYARLTKTQRALLDVLCDAPAGVTEASLRAAVNDPAVEDALGFLMSYGYATSSDPVRLRYELYRDFRPKTQPEEAPDPALVNRIAVPTIFLSYSENDETYVEQLRKQLAALSRGSSIDIWDQKRISYGVNKEAEIKRAISGASVVVLLVSADFLTSPIITETELPKIVKAAQSGKCKVLCMRVKSVADNLDKLPGERLGSLVPIAELPPELRDREIAESAKVIYGAATGWATWKKG